MSSPLARALGWFSLGLGFAQLAAPRQRVANLIGLPGDEDDQKVMRLVGAREIASGFGILAQAKPTPWLWSRVGGDAMDLALLKSAMESPRSDRDRVATATMAVLGITAADLLCSTKMSAEPNAPYEAMEARGVHATAAVTVQAPINEVYGYWDGLQSLPRFMSDAASVQITGDRQSHWSLSAPAGMTLEWDVEITESRPNELISWRTAEGSSVMRRGQCSSALPRVGVAPKSSSMPASARRAASWARRSLASLPRPSAPRSAMICGASSNSSSWGRSSTPTTASSQVRTRPSRRGRSPREQTPRRALPESRLQSYRCILQSVVLAGFQDTETKSPPGDFDESHRVEEPEHRPGRGGARPADPQLAGCDRQDHLHRHLRVGSAPAARLRAGDDAG